MVEVEAEEEDVVVLPEHQQHQHRRPRRPRTDQFPLEMDLRHSRLCQVHNPLTEQFHLLRINLLNRKQLNLYQQLLLNSSRFKLNLLFNRPLYLKLNRPASRLIMVSLIPLVSPHQQVKLNQLANRLTLPVNKLNLLQQVNLNLQGKLHPLVKLNQLDNNLNLVKHQELDNLNLQVSLPQQVSLLQQVNPNLLLEVKDNLHLLDKLHLLKEAGEVLKQVEEQHKVEGEQHKQVEEQRRLVEVHLQVVEVVHLQEVHQQLVLQQVVEVVHLQPEVLLLLVVVHQLLEVEGVQHQLEVKLLLTIHW